MIILNFALQFGCVWESSTIRHVIVFVFDCLVFVIGFVDVIIGNFYSLGVGCVWCPLPLSGNFYGNQFLQCCGPQFGQCTIEKTHFTGIPPNRKTILIKKDLFCEEKNYKMVAPPHPLPFVND